MDTANQMQMHAEEPTEHPGENQLPPETVPLQALQFIKTELLKTQKSIKDLQCERRLLRKQLSHWAGAVQVLQESHEDSHSRLKAEIRALNDNSECMRTELQQLRQNVQDNERNASDLPTAYKQSTWNNNSLQIKSKAVLSPSKAKGSHQCSKLRRRLNVKTLPISYSNSWGVSDLTQVETPGQKNRKDWHNVQYPFQTEEDHLKAQNRDTLMHMRHLCKSIKAAKNFRDGKMTEGGQCLSSDQTAPLKSTQESQLDACSSLMHPHQEVSTMKNEEAELHELVVKLKDALSFQIQPGHLPGLKQEFLFSVEQVCRSYSDLINQIIEPTLK